jgi:stearoyl-CoA desaturase (delta-9 desaturase)
MFPRGTVHSCVNGFKTDSYNNAKYTCFRKIQPAENRVVSALALGEGWHNYHHTFPWDYKTSELGDYMLNVTTGFIDFFAYIGWAYDLKQASKTLIQKVVQQEGDGSHPKWSHMNEVSEEAEQLLNANNEVEDLLHNTEDEVKGM